MTARYWDTLEQMISLEHLGANDDSQMQMSLKIGLERYYKNNAKVLLGAAYSVPSRSGGKHHSLVSLIGSSLTLCPCQILALDILEGAFKLNPFPNPGEKEVLANHSGLSQKQVSFPLRPCSRDSTKSIWYFDRLFLGDQLGENENIVIANKIWHANSSCP